jgi:hypothetical protein
MCFAMFIHMHFTVFIDETGSKWLHHQALHVIMQHQIWHQSSAIASMVIRQVKI